MIFCASASAFGTSAGAMSAAIAGGTSGAAGGVAGVETNGGVCGAGEPARIREIGGRTARFIVPSDSGRFGLGFSSSISERPLSCAFCAGAGSGRGVAETTSCLGTVDGDITVIGVWGTEGGVRGTASFGSLSRGAAPFSSFGETAGFAAAFVSATLETVRLRETDLLDAAAFAGLPAGAVLRVTECVVVRVGMSVS